MRMTMNEYTENAIRYELESDTEPLIKYLKDMEEIIRNQNQMIEMLHKSCKDLHEMILLVDQKQVLRNKLT